jgi:Domain of unknown function (DUF4917)
LPDQIPSFADVISTATAQGKKPHLLLGNGFSRAWKDDIFAYSALRDRADFGGLSPHAWQVFDALGTSDFEAVMRALRTTGTLLPVYDQNQLSLSKVMRRDAEGLKEVLVQTIAGSHPASPNAVTQEAYAACRRFLANFADIYTVNYDLLLYWTLMQTAIAPEVPCDDGFRAPEDDPEAAFVTWDPGSVGSQTVHYVHGALHLFDSGPELRKYTWCRTGVRLIDQIRDAMGRGYFPVFVSEGDSQEKLARIRHSAYLSRAERSLIAIGGSLVVFGHSLSEADRHIGAAIARSRVRQLFMGIHGDPEAPYNRALRTRADALATSRSPRNPLNVSFYSAETCSVWK